jgi:hypothetical protein
MMGGCDATDTAACGGPRAGTASAAPGWLAQTAACGVRLQGTHPVGLQQPRGQAQGGGLAGAAAADDAHRLAAADLEGGPTQDVLAAGGRRRAGGKARHKVELLPVQLGWRSLALPRASATVATKLNLTPTCQTCKSSTHLPNMQAQHPPAKHASAAPPACQPCKGSTHLPKDFHTFLNSISTSPSGAAPGLLRPLVLAADCAMLLLPPPPLEACRQI